MPRRIDTGSGTCRVQRRAACALEGCLAQTPIGDPDDDDWEDDDNGDDAPDDDDDDDEEPMQLGVS